MPAARASRGHHHALRRCIPCTPRRPSSTCRAGEKPPSAGRSSCAVPAPRYRDRRLAEFGACIGLASFCGTARQAPGYIRQVVRPVPRSSPGHSQFGQPLHRVACVERVPGPSHRAAGLKASRRSVQPNPRPQSTVDLIDQPHECTGPESVQPRLVRAIQQRVPRFRGPTAKRAAGNQDFRGRDES